MIAVSLAALAVSVVALVWQWATWWVDRRPRLVIIQRGTSDTNVVMQRTDGLVFLIAEAAVVNVSPKVTAVIRGFGLDAIGRGDAPFDLLEDPHDAYPTGDVYKVTDFLSYPREDVINHHTYAEGVLTPGAVFEGVLIGRGRVSALPNVRRGGFVLMKVSVLDQLHRAHSAQFKFSVGGRVTPPTSTGC
jgi:hypothetical protein